MDEMNLPNRAGKTLKDYLPLAARKLGIKQKLQEEPLEGGPQMEARPYNEGRPVIDKKAIEKAIKTLKDYKDGKRNLESRIVEEEQWWKLRQWDVIRGKDQKTDRPEPTSAWLFNSIANKHADIMDNYPEPNVLPRERMDEQDAKTLSSVLPVVFERNHYEETYSDAGWYKLKHGVVAKGVFWNKDLEEGMGDIDIRFIDMLNIFWEPGITDLQASRNLFVVDLKDNDLLEQEYPQLKGQVNAAGREGPLGGKVNAAGREGPLGGKVGGQIIDVKQYVYDDSVDVTGKSVVVDWYYKKRNAAGKVVLHYCKFVGSEIIYASENEQEYAERGFYDHGKYPICFDVLFPEEGTPVGFGYIAIMKSPQMYIDKLSQAILENTIMTAKPRYFGKKTVGINKDQFLDLAEPIVDVEGDISEERFRPIEVQQMGGNVLTVLQMKIDELKETSSNRDVSQGSSSGGVTAAAAIAALQEAGNKTSRDMISASYRSYTEECYLAIELIRQFYDETRSFRITGDTGRYEYIQYSNAALQGQPIPPAYAGQELESGYTQAVRRPVFDIVIKPQKRSSYSKLSQNELAKELYGMGFFNPELAEQSMAALEVMEFDGKEKVRERVQQGQTLLNQMAQMQQQLVQMAAFIYAATGQDVLGTQGGAQAQPAAQAASGGLGQAQKAAQTNAMTSYGERLAKNATPKMND